MSSKKIFFVMLGVLALMTLFAIGGVVLGTSMLKKKSNDLVELKLQDRLIEEQQVALVQANKDIEKYKELETIAKTIVPQDKDQAKTVREITTLADQSKIRVSSITFPSSTLGTKQAPASTNTNSGASGGTTTPKAQTSPISQVTPVSGINGLYQLEVTIDVSDIAPTYNQLIDFLNRLEQNRRTAQVTSISIDPVSGNRNYVEFSLTMNVFVKP